MILVATIASLLTTCTSTTTAAHLQPSASSPASGASVVGAVAMAPTPPDVLAQCRGVPLVATTCPTSLPRAQHYVGKSISQPPGYRFNVFSISDGIPTGSPSKDAPPAFVHVVLQSGRGLVRAYPFAIPSQGVGTPLTNELLKSARSTPVLISTATWGGRRGVVVLMPPYSMAETIDAGHLVFLWSDGGSDSEVSVHAWSPASQVLPTLQAIVESIPPT